MGSIIAVIGFVLLVLVLVTILLDRLVYRFLHDNTRKLAIIILVLLVLQFVLGMLANLFSQIPSYQPWTVFHEFGYISLHVLNGTILTLLSGIYLSKISRAKESKMMGIIGHISIFIAFASGFMFVLAGQNNIFSFTMSLGFISALLVYAYEAFSGR